MVRYRDVACGGHAHGSAGRCYILHFIFDDTATTEIYTVRNTLSLHDALPIYPPLRTTFAGREILGQAAWTQGPVLMQALGMLATVDLRGLGHNSARYIHVVS